MNKRTFAKQIKLFYTLAKLTVELAPKMFSITLPRPYLKVSRFVSLSCATNDCRLKKSLIRGNMAGCRNFKWKCCSIEQIKFRGITGGSGCNAVKLHLFFWLVVKTTSKPGLLLVEQVITCHVALLYGWHVNTVCAKRFKYQSFSTRKFGSNLDLEKIFKPKCPFGIRIEDQIGYLFPIFLHETLFLAGKF